VDVLGGETSTLDHAEQGRHIVDALLQVTGGLASVLHAVLPRGSTTGVDATVPLAASQVQVHRSNR
jgi:hypothetical protein